MGRLRDVVGGLLDRIFEYPGNGYRNPKLGALVVLTFVLGIAGWLALTEGVAAAMPMVRLSGYVFAFLCLLLALDVGLEKLYYWWSER